MTTINTKTFLENPTRFFNLARKEDVAVKHGKSMYKLMYKPVVEEQQVMILQPDGVRRKATADEINDLHSAITAEELLVGIHEDIRRKFASRV